MIRIYIARQRYDAWLVADRLKQAGIRAHVFNQHASSIVGDVPPRSSRSRRCGSSARCDRERAQIVLRDIETAGRTGDVACAACGEDSPGNFDPVLELRQVAL